jgi:predicted Zn-dependent peptidase
VKETQRTLPNGLRVVVVPQPQLHRAHVALFARVGSRFETPKTNGISHFLEHMMYRGTPRLPHAHQVNLAFESLGGYLYAATQVDYGVFSVTVPEENIEAATALFGEVVQSPTFPDIDVERGIVIEEILEDLDDEGRDVDADNLSRRLIYPDHPLGFTITGTEDHIQSFTEDTLRTHFRRHYTGETTVLAIAGAVDPARMLDVAERAFEALPRGARIDAVAPTHDQTKPRLSLVDNASSQTELRLSFRAVSERSPQRAAMDMLMRILDDGMSTRLYHRICDDQGLCYDVSSVFDGYEDDGILDFAAGVQHGRAAKVTREILALLRELGETGPTEAELLKARNRNAWDTRAMKDSAEDTAGFYAGGLLFERFQRPEERVEENARVTRDDIRDLARAVAQPERLNVIVVGTPGKEETKRLEEEVLGFRGVP